MARESKGTHAKQLYEQGLSAEEIAEQTGLMMGTVRVYINIWKAGFRSQYEYQQHLAEDSGFGSLYEYRQHRARGKGFESVSEYQRHLAKKNQYNPENKTLSALITTRLKELGRNQQRLAEQTNIPKGIISKYKSGYNLPKGENERRLLEALEVPYETLDEFLAGTDLTELWEDD